MPRGCMWLQAVAAVGRRVGGWVRVGVGGGLAPATQQCRLDVLLLLLLLLATSPNVVGDGERKAQAERGKVAAAPSR